ncbi:MAG TPA: hypothetical protein VFZ73_07940 [Gemmatimonadaceae bacterium]
MTTMVQRRGQYTLFETPRGNRILHLGGNEWFAWVRGEQGEILVRSDADHDRETTLGQGEFYLVDFENDASFTDVPHLFLENEGAFQEVILPNGLPTARDLQTRIVSTEKTISRETLEQHLATDQRDAAAAGGDRDPARADASNGMRSDRELPIPDYDELSVRGAKVRLDDLTPDELRTLRAYEAEHKQRKTLIHEIDRRLR